MSETSATARHGDDVSVHYEGNLQDGSIFDASEESAPLSFTLGGGQLLPEFEQAVTGMAVGEKKVFTIKAVNAYGEFRDDLIFEVDRAAMPEDLELQIGLQLQVSTTDGQAIVAAIRSVNDEAVKLDANHPLAGEDLTFSIQLASIG